MKNKLWLLVIRLVLFLPSPLSAHPFLLFTEKEVNLIYQTLGSQTESNQSSSNVGELFLLGILYVDANHWSLWLNNMMIQSDKSHQIENFHIEHVTPNEVQFSLISPHSAVPITFLLQPNQMFSAKKNRVTSQ